MQVLSYQVPNSMEVLMAMCLRAVSVTILLAALNTNMHLATTVVSLGEEASFPISGKSKGHLMVHPSQERLT